jgi:uncharacterized damage-inducible protein DinB
MTFSELLKSQIEDTYRITDALLCMVEECDLDWRPSQGENWWTVGQLLRHITVSCGIWCKGFATGVWDDAGDVDHTQIPEGESLPRASAYRSIDSVEAARQALARDKVLALQVIEQTTDAELLSKNAVAPWNPNPRVLGLRILDMVRHLESHKSQLFYYLKLIGKPVHTGHLWGMGNISDN